MARLDLSFLTQDPDFCDTVLLRRFFITGWVHGRPQYTGTDREIKAVIQPASSRDLTMIDETSSGAVTQGLVCYSAEALVCAEDDQRADQIIFGGQVYDVVTADDWSPNGKYWRSFLQRVKDE